MISKWASLNVVNFGRVLLIHAFNVRVLSPINMHILHGSSKTCSPERLGSLLILFETSLTKIETSLDVSSYQLGLYSELLEIELWRKNRKWRFRFDLQILLVQLMLLAMRTVGINFRDLGGFLYI